jgi:integration host factor subunit alpha
MTLTKATLVKNLIENKNAASKEDAQLLVNAFFEIIRESLEKGENVKLTNLGKFKVRQKKERIGRNPKTGEETVIKARRVVTFSASQNLRRRIAKANGKI